MIIETDTINQEVIDRTDFINTDKLLHSEVVELLEEQHLTELDHRIGNMSKREMITVCCVAVRKFPFAYQQVLADYVMELTRKGRKT